MVTSINIADCVKALLHSADKPKLAHALVGSMDARSFSEANIEHKMLFLGALLALGDSSKFKEMLELTDFAGLSWYDRSLLVVNIFSVFCDERGVLLHHHDVLSSLLALLSAVCPEELDAHKKGVFASMDTNLIEFEYDEKLSDSIKGVVFFREHVFEQGSRKHEFGYRIATAMASQGWNISLLSIADISHFYAQEKHDIALVDVAALGETSCTANEVLSVLRRFFRKIIVVEPDPWKGAKDNILVKVADGIDCIWGFTAGWELINSPAFKQKSILFPNVGGFDIEDKNIATPISWKTVSSSFVGSVQIYNINRVYWLLEILLKNMPISIHVTDPGVDDGLDRAASLNMYAKLLSSTNASINLTTRCDGSRIITGRSVEILSLNRLLIQESCPDFHRYYVEGEHFLEFSDLEKLSEILEFVTSDPESAQKISEQGHKFYKDKYSSKKMVEHLQTWL